MGNPPPFMPFRSHFVIPCIAIRGKQLCPLFVLAHKATLTKAIFTSALTFILSEFDLNPRLYNMHSFQIGAATAAT